MTENKPVWQTYCANVTPLPAPKRKSANKAALGFSKPRASFEPPRFIDQGTEKPLSVLSKKAQRALGRAPWKFDGKLDLHGMTQNEAYASLCGFVQRKAAEGARFLLIVTGKGKEGSSVLRRQFPLWCAAPPLSNFISTLHQAAQNHGGSGAFYMRLKRTQR